MIFFLILAIAQAQTNATNGFVPAHQECIDIMDASCSNQTACWHVKLNMAQLAMGVDPNGVNGTLIGFAPTGLYPGFTAVENEITKEELAHVWAQYAFGVTKYIYGTNSVEMNQIDKVLNSILDCEAQHAGLIWADYVGFYTSMQTCMSDPDCVTAMNNIRKAASEKPPKPFHKFASNWDYYEAIDWYAPNLDNSKDAFCGISFAAAAEGNMKAIYHLDAASALLLTDANDIVKHCGEGITKMIISSLVLFSCLSFFGGLVPALIGCYCWNKRQNKENGI